MFLGLDLGTSGLRGILLDDEHKLIAESEADIKTSYPHAGWSEQNPDDWIAACVQVTENLQLSHPKQFAALKAIGLSGQMHGATLLDADGMVLRPCILWNDTRSHREAAHLDQIPEFRAISGNIVFPGFTAPKLEWIRANEPAVFARVEKVLLPKDYLRLWLTGDYISDFSDSSGTSWLNVRAREWSDTCLELSHMALEQMPALAEGNAAAGVLRQDIMRRWNIQKPVIVAGGAADNAAMACGMGLVGDGTVVLSIGTSGVVLRAMNSYQSNTDRAVHCFCHAVPERWLQLGVTLSATNCINWLAKSLNESVAELVASLPTELSGPNPIIFLPYLSGERTPHNDSGIRSAFIGIDSATDAEDLKQAVMEGVAFALRECMDALEDGVVSTEDWFVVGGGSLSPFWLETLATILKHPLAVPTDPQLGAGIGAARLASCAATNQDYREIMTVPKATRVIEPRTDISDRYEEQYKLYKNCYQALKPVSLLRRL
ncbi:MAG: xylulokinase [Aestuariivita sp.]|nr:xylulokinase [Aestuariivita sp.]MCY4347878.1 xylulokinase [Aestuariivita sp.]